MNIITFPAISRMPFSFPWAGSISIMRYLRLLIKTAMVYSGFQPRNCESLWALLAVCAPALPKTPAMP